VTFLDFWMMAAESDRGLFLRTPDPARAKTLLYAARAKAKETPVADVIASLVIRTSPQPALGDLWIMKPCAEAVE
jgi:hypothetical protein